MQRHCLGLILVFLCTPAIAEDAREDFRRGNRLLAAGEYDSAITFFNAAIACDPHNPAAYHSRAVAWYYKREYDNAISDCGDALAIDASYVEAYDSRGDAWEAKGSYDRAIADYDTALQIHHRDARAHAGRGLAWYDKREYDKAIKDCSTAIQISPNYAKAYDNRGKARYGKGELDKAIRDFTEAAARDRSFSRAYADRGAAWFSKGDYEKARDDYCWAIGLDPQSVPAHYGFAWLQATCPDPRYRDGKEAVVNATVAVEVSGGKWYGYAAALAAAYAECGNFKNARQWQENAIALAPDDDVKRDGRSRLELYKAGMPYRGQGK